jgi:hypothetical protein
MTAVATEWPSCDVCDGPTRADVVRPASTDALWGSYRIAVYDACRSARTLSLPDGKVPNSAETRTPSVLGHPARRAASGVLRLYHFVGGDELLAIASSRR